MPGDQEDDRAGSKNIVPGDQNRKINNRAGTFIRNIRVELCSSLEWITLVYLRVTVSTVTDRASVVKAQAKSSKS